MELDTDRDMGERKVNPCPGASVEKGKGKAKPQVKNHALQENITGVQEADWL